MIPAWSGTTVRETERPFVEAGQGEALMARAAHGLALACVSVLRDRRGSVPGSRVVVLAGTGNNGGDALWAAVTLRRRGASVLVIATGDRLHQDGRQALQAVGARFCSLDDLGEEAAAQACLTADLVLDGVLGTGATGGLRGAVKDTVVAVKHGLVERKISGEPCPAVVAVDVPSGIEADTGRSPGPVLAADLSVSFGGAKAAHLLPPAHRLSGELQPVSIGIEHALPSPRVIGMEDADLDALWPYPVAEDHKYTRGVVGIVAGSPEYPGAALLCTRSAVAAGAGMVRFLGDEQTRSLVTVSTPEVVAGSQAPSEVHVQSWVAGPGAVDDEQRRRIEQVLLAPEPAVLDAGAISVVGRFIGDGRLQARHVLTPHAGEVVDLLTWCQAWGLVQTVPERSEVEANPARWAELLARTTGATVLLKGAVTVVAGPGEGPVFAVANSSPWLAAAGSGDCLAGIMGALLANVAGAMAGGPGAFERRLRAWVTAAPLSEPARDVMRQYVTGDGQWALFAALAATLHGRASRIGGEGPQATDPDRIRAALTAS